MKVESPDLPHKTEAGVIRLGLKDEAELRAAYAAVTANAARVAPPPRINGVLVELMRDASTALAPVTPAEAEAMLRRLKGFAALQGFRGALPVDLVRLADIVCRLSEFAADQRDRIAELDVNPIICAGADAVAVDALILRSAAVS